MLIELPEKFGREYKGILEFIVRDRKGNVVDHRIEPNIVKIFAKEMLSHRLPSSEVWDPDANSGTGAWEASGIDPDEEFSARYILFGASFDENHVPLDQDDPRYYTTDPVTGIKVPIRLGPGADYDGGLINAIPLAEPNRPLKRVESITFEPSYQPSFTPYVQEDVRAINNVVKLQTTLRLDEYNGFGLTESDFFTVTEVALAGGKKITSLGSECEIDPVDLFLDGDMVVATADGTDVITLDLTGTGGTAITDNIKEGDQIKIVSTDTGDLDQISPYYLVLSKLGVSVQLDRVPTDSNNVPITGTVGVYRSTLRIFSHRILTVPLRRSDSYEIECVWRIIFN